MKQTRKNGTAETNSQESTEVETRKPKKSGGNSQDRCDTRLDRNSQELNQTRIHKLA